MQMIKQAKMTAMSINGIEENNLVLSCFNQYYPFFNICERWLSKALPVSKCETEINNAVPTQNDPQNKYKLF